MEKIFFDASALVAIFSKKDGYHQCALEAFRQFIHNRDYFVTTDYILDEVFTVLKLKCGHETAFSLAKDILENEEFEIIFIDRELFNNALENFFKKTKDHPDLSFTDCTSFAVMKSLGIIKGFSFDKHFRLFNLHRIPNP